VRDQHDSRASRHELVDGRQRRADPGVVSNVPGVVERHVEVDPNERALPANLGVGEVANRSLVDHRAPSVEGLTVARP
jgi:hypothetical protein